MLLLYFLSLYQNSLTVHIFSPKFIGDLYSGCFEFLSGDSYTTVPLWLVTGALSCSILGTIFSCFFTFLNSMLASVH